MPERKTKKKDDPPQQLDRDRTEEHPQEEQETEEPSRAPKFGRYSASDEEQGE